VSWDVRSVPAVRRTSIPPVNGTAMLEDVCTSSPIFRGTGELRPDGGEVLQRGRNRPVPDHRHATLVARTPRGFVAIFGCAHARLRQYPEGRPTAFPGERLLSVVGGCTGERKRSDPGGGGRDHRAFKADRFTFHGGHCTGARTIACFREAFGDDAVKPLGAGRHRVLAASDRGDLGTR